MKNLILVTAALLTLNTMAISLSEIAGTYEISPVGAPDIVNIVELKANGEMTLVENSPFGQFTCSGVATVTGDIVDSEVECPNGLSFTQRIDFTGVEISDEFVAPVFSSLFGAEVPMTFIRM